MLQLQTTWEKDRAIYIFKNGSGMEVIGAAGSVNKCNNKKKKEKKLMIPGICTDWGALENESTGDIKDVASSS